MLQTATCLLYFFSAGKDSEQVLPWGESSPDDGRYVNHLYTDPRDREKELHDMNRR